ncbi:MAG: hydroxylamine reductase, partial [Cetobacterium sp.]
MEKVSMFCFQCQETAGNKGCSVVGVCGKKPTTSNLQDLLIYTAKGISILREAFSLETRLENAKFNSEVDYYITNALFITITNANFDDKMISEEILKGLELRTKLASMMKELNLEPKRLKNHDAATFVVKSIEEMNSKALTIGVLSTTNEDVRSLRELVVYGLKGMAAYYEHSVNLGYQKS